MEDVLRQEETIVEGLKLNRGIVDFSASSKVANLATRHVEILGARVDDVLLDEAIERIEFWVERRKHDSKFSAQQVVTLNPEYLTLAQRDSGLMAIINSAGMVTPDGIGLIYAGKALRRPLRGRVTGVELTHALAMRSAQLSQTKAGELRLFLLGAAPGIAQKAAYKLATLYPGVTIAGTFSGKAGPEGDAETVAQVRAAQADIVLVAYGMSKQDRWLVRNLQASGAVVGIGVGGTFDYLAEAVTTPPEAVKKLGMEWAYRILSQKDRWKRAHFVPRFIGSVVVRTPLHWLWLNQSK
jgi:N-acetylglucosaminyldiphosphoundecaprenol N-acetyl-beta-D-mannosaminyltransferase